jgi:hypothetical protein
MCQSLSSVKFRVNGMSLVPRLSAADAELIIELCLPLVRPQVLQAFRQTTGKQGIGSERPEKPKFK